MPTITTTTIVDVIDARPEAAGMGVEFVGVAGAVDVRPHIGAPRHGDGLALTVGRRAVGEVASESQKLDRRRAAPAVHLPIRLPAAEIGMLRTGMRLVALNDDGAQFGIQRRRIGHVRHHDRRGEQRDDLGRDAHAATLHPNGSRKEAGTM